MADPRVDKLAKTLVHYSVEVKPGDWVLIQGNIVAMPLVEAVLRHVVRAGGHPTTLLSADSLRAMQLKEASEEQLKWVSPLEPIIFGDVDVLITLWGTENTRAMSGVDPQKQQMSQAARRPVMERYMERIASGDLRWVGTQFPCAALAQEADMGLAEFEDFVYAATHAADDDPIKHWREVHERQQKLINWLKGKREVTIRGPHVDLKLSIDGRRFLSADGHKNMPDGEIFTSPVEDSAEGWIRYTYPALYNGREVDGIELEFKEGKVVKAGATKNEELLLSQLDVDDEARYLGEFAIGTNYAIDRFTKSILYDEKIGGTIHLALGHGFAEIGGKNRSSLHWDMVCDMRQDSEIRVDGELFYKDGEFQV
jgi:aminopeptidase